MPLLDVWQCVLCNLGDSAGAGRCSQFFLLLRVYAGITLEGEKISRKPWKLLCSQ